MKNRGVMKNIGKLLFVALILTSALRWSMVAHAATVGSIYCSNQAEGIAMGECTGTCQSTFGSCFAGCPPSGYNEVCWDTLYEYNSGDSDTYYMDTTCDEINFSATCIENCSNEMNNCVLNCAAQAGCSYN